MQAVLLDPITHTIITSEKMLRGRLDEEQTECVQTIHESAIEMFRRTQHALTRYDEGGLVSLANYTHDWLSPAATVLSYVDFLINVAQTSLSEQQVARVWRIFYKMHFVRQQIMNLLDYAQLQQQRSPNFSKFRLGDVLEARMLQVQTAVDLKWNLPADLPPVYSSKHYVKRALENIVLNALQYTTIGYVAVEALEAKDTIEIVVTDTGVGIAPDAQVQIFDPFVPCHPQSKGLGLGLAVAKAFVTRQNGTLHLRSVPEHGTSARLTVPLANSRKITKIMT